MRTYAIILLIVFVFAGGLFAIGWEKTYGGTGYDAGFSIVEAHDGGYVFTNCKTESWWEVDTSIFGADTFYDSSLVEKTRTFITKIDPMGVVVWDSCFRDDGCCSPIIFSVSSGGYLLYLVNTYYRLSNLGGVLWTRTHDYSGYIYSIIQSSDEGFILAGTDSSDFYLAVTDSLGNPLLEKTYGGSGDDVAYRAIQTSDRGYAIIGNSSSFGGTWLVRTDSVGIALWAKVYHEIIPSYPYCIVQTSDGGFFIVSSEGRHHERKMHLVHTNSSGDVVWNKYFNDREACDIIKVSDSSYVILATLEDTVYLLAIDSDGNEIWSNAYGEGDTVAAYCIRQTSDGGYIIIGEAATYHIDIYIIKTDSLGYTDINETPFQKPDAIAISAYPNPFNSSVAIDLVGARHAVPLPADIEIFDINGRMVYAPSPSVPLPKGEGGKNLLPPGEGGSKSRMRAFIWTPDESITSGVYLVRATIGDRAVSKKVVYLK